MAIVGLVLAHNGVPMRSATWPVVMKKQTHKSPASSKRRRRAEKRPKSNRPYRALFDNAGDAIFIHDKEGRILVANATACRQYGYTRSELISMTVDLLLIPEKRIHAHVKKRIAQIMKQRWCKFETVHQRKDGTLLPYERKIWLDFVQPTYYQVLAVAAFGLIKYRIC